MLFWISLVLAGVLLAVLISIFRLDRQEKRNQEQISVDFDHYKTKELQLRHHYHKIVL